MVAILLAILAAEAVAPAYEKYQIDNETTCIGKADLTFEKADSWSEAGFKYTVSGARAEVHGTAKEARIGLLSAVKDFSAETLANLKTFLAAFKKAGVSAIIVDGDSAYGVDDQDSTLSELFTWLGEQGMPVYGIIGNSESRSSFNRALLSAFRKHPNVFNLNLLRRVEGDGFTLVSLPGYYDRRYIHESAGCQYKPEDAQELSRIARGAPSPVVLVTHGPPRQEGRAALDVTEDGHNVGDPDLAVVIAEAKIPFGVFGHILESGGRATDLQGRKPVKPGQAVPALYVNPGPAFADPWGLNGGGVSRGMAAILTIKGGKGEWQQLRAGGGKPAKGRSTRRSR
jgi:Icc-related predicted phosphoesterase